MLLQPERDVAKAKWHRADFTTSLMAYAFAVHFDLGPEFKRHARTALADVAAAERDDARAMQKTISTDIGCLGSNMSQTQLASLLTLLCLFRRPPNAGNLCQAVDIQSFLGPLREPRCASRTSFCSKWHTSTPNFGPLLPLYLPSLLHLLCRTNNLYIARGPHDS